MASCSFCKVASKEKLKSCVCGKVSYCSKECQTKDWKVHKPSCPPFIIRESPGKGRGLFATRKIKEGQLILEEHPLLTLGAIELNEFKINHFPNIDIDTKVKILQLHDPAENISTLELESETVENLVVGNLLLVNMEDKTDEISQIFRIFYGNYIQICAEKDLYSNTTEYGLYNKISLINHACVPNATWTWVMGDFKRKQVRALMTIEKDEEILVNYCNTAEFVYGAREFRRQKLLRTKGFLCQCSECSLEGEDLEDSERVRAEIRENDVEIVQLMRSQGSPRRSIVKKAMKLAQRKTKLVQKLDIRDRFVAEMVLACRFSVEARRLGISCRNEPEIFKQEAWKYAQMFGDYYIRVFNIALSMIGI